MSSNSSDPTARRADELFAERMHKSNVMIDRFFGVLLTLEWLGGIIAALIISPRTWSGAESNPHIHLAAAVFLGGLLAVVPGVLILARPGRRVTRYVVSAAQAGFSALLIHLSGGRIETHFHIFGSLAFLAFYRDYLALLPATLVVAVDHLVRGVFWPESVYGVLVASPFRTLEHAAWVVFEDVFLVWGCLRGLREARSIARSQAELEKLQQSTEAVVEQRTSELLLQTIELEASLAEVRAMSAEMAQSSKMQSMGQLAAGLAHEINTPMQYIQDNTEYLRDSLDILFNSLATIYSRLDANHPPVSWEERRIEIEKLFAECDYESMVAEIPSAIADTLDGIERVVTIVQAMKEFSHPGGAHKAATDLNKSINSAVTISRNRWKQVAELREELEPGLPTIAAFPADLNQVLLNLIVNAADAIAEARLERDDDPGTITLRTRTDEDCIVLEVADNGPGIPDDVLPHIFDHFFTTKEVGKGTGQGLSLCYQIVTNKHGGSIGVQSCVGKGTTVSVRLPLDGRSEPKPHSESPSSPQTALPAATAP